MLVVSMLVSMVLTRLAADGSLILCCRKGSVREKTGKKEEKEDEGEEDLITKQIHARVESVPAILLILRRILMLTKS